MNPTPIGIPTGIWVVLEQGNGTPTLVSTPGCECVDQFKKAIKKEYAHRLASYDASDLTLFTADGMTEIATRMLLTDLPLEFEANGDQRALVVKASPTRESSKNDLFEAGSISLLTAEDIEVQARKRQRIEITDLTTQFQSFANAQLFYTCLQTPNGVFLPYPQTKIKKLYVRKCYRDVFNLLLKNIKMESVKTIGPKSKSFAISGTPGIGKSLFFVYILYRLMKDFSEKTLSLKPNRVVYQNATEYTCFNLENQTVNSLNRMEAIQLVRQQDTLYIVDGQTTPMSSSCITLFISSPRSQQYKEFVKQKMAKEWYFPVWTIKELQSCRSQCYPELSIKILKERYRVYGGVARMVFDRNYSIILPNIMEEALADVDAVMGVRNIGIPTKIFATTHTLLHIIVSNDRLYQCTHVDIASKYVGEKLWELHYAQMITNLKEMFGGSPNVISGHLFEIYGHRIFSKGDMTLNCRDLQDDSISDFVLERLDGSPITFGRNNLPNPLLTSYYEASDDASFPAIDSLSLQGMFQFTVAQEHPIRGAQILKRLCALYKDPKIYFVVPPHRFAKFKIQKFLLTQVNSTVKDMPELKQFVLELPV